MKIKRMVWGAMFGAMIAVATLYLKIPAFPGYYHLGDGVIYAAAVLMGPVVGALAAGIGSALADVVGGYAIWAGPTFIIKFLTALVIGLLAYQARSWPRLIGGMAAGAAVTLIGYSITAYFLYGRQIAVALAEFYGNLGQTGSGIVIGLVLVTLLRRVVSFSHLTR